MIGVQRFEKLGKLFKRNISYIKKQKEETKTKTKIKTRT